MSDELRATARLASDRDRTLGRPDAASSEARTALFTTTVDWSKAPNYGVWDAWWALSEPVRLTLLAQVIDYDGTLPRVYASPPSLTVDLPGQTLAERTFHDRAMKARQISAQPRRRQARCIANQCSRRRR